MLKPTGVIFMSSNIKKLEQAGPAERADAGKSNHRSLGDRLARNTAIAALALLTVVGIRQSGPEGFLQTMQHAVESEWDQNVGRLTYVGNTVAESIQVFGQNGTKLTCPVAASATETWSQDTPFLLYENAGQVFAAASGEVSQIAHDDEERFILRVLHPDGLSTVYYGLDSCLVQEGDSVDPNTLLGMAGPVFAFETLRAGKAVNYTSSMAAREGAQ